jgi:PAS domain S-box-containing protein
MKPVENSLNNSEQLLEILIKISNTYINIPVDEFDSTLNLSLAELGKFVKADRFYVFDYDFIQMTASNTHEWCAAGIEPQIEYFQSTPVDEMYDLINAHQNGKIMFVHDVNSLEPGSFLREVLEPQGIKSLLTIPLMNEAECIGFIGFDWVRKHHQYTENELKFLEFFAEMIVNFKKRLLSNQTTLNLMSELNKLNEELEKKVEERTAEIKKMSQIHQAIYENSSVTIMATNEDGIIEYINPAGVKLLGYDYDDLIGKQRPSFLHDKNELLELYLKDNTNGKISEEDMYLYFFDQIRDNTTEWNWIRKDGSMIRISLSQNTLRDSEGYINGYMGVIVDVTSEKKVLEKLENSERRLNALFQSHSAPMLIINPDNGLILDANKAAQNFYGYNFNDEKKSIYEINVTKDIDVKGKMNNAMSNQMNTFLFTHLLADRTVKYVEVHSTPIVFNEGNVLFSIIHDVTERREAEENQKNTMQLLQSLIQNLQFGTLFENAERKISLTNQTFCDLFHIPYSPDDMIGFDCVEAAQTTKLLMKNPEGFIDKIDKVLSQKNKVENQVLELLDGRFLEFDYVPIYQEKQLTGHLWNYRDITERTNQQNSTILQKNFANTLSSVFTIEDAINVSIKTFANFHDFDSGEIYLLNQKTNALELVVRKNVSDDFVEKLSSFSCDTPLFHIMTEGKSVYGKFNEILTNYEIENDINPILSVAIIPIIFKKEVIGSINLGSRKSVDFNNYIRTTVELMAIQFATALNRIRLTEALVSSQENFKNLFDTIDDFLFILDVKGNIIRVNKTVVEKLGYTEEELKTMHVLSVHPPQRREEAGIIVQNMLEGNELYCPVPLCCKDGTEISVETRVVHGEWDEQPVLFGLSRDTTESAKLMKTMEQTIQKEKELSDLKSRFVSMASHEFRTPLASILMSSETLQAYWKRMNDKQLDDKLNNIKHQVLHLESIVSNVMMVAKIQEGKITIKPQEINFNQLCIDIIDNFNAGERLTNKIVFISEFSNLIMSLDERLIIQVLQNLISNAVKYSQPEPIIKIELKLDKKFLLLIITDNGIGIPEKDQLNLFQPFFRASNTKNIEGNGLGLNIVKQSLILHGGDLCFESEVGKGSTFKMYLPVEIITHYELVFSQNNQQYL